jgi:hypothetical protein
MIVVCELNTRQSTLEFMDLITGRVYHWLPYHMHAADSWGLLTRLFKKALKLGTDRGCILYPSTVAAKGPAAMQEWVRKPNTRSAVYELLELQKPQQTENQKENQMKKEEHAAKKRPAGARGHTAKKRPAAGSWS